MGQCTSGRKASKKRLKPRCFVFHLMSFICTFIKSALGGYITLVIGVSGLSGEHLSQRRDVLRVYFGESDKEMKKLKNIKGCPDLAMYICITSLEGEFFPLLSALFVQAECNFRYLHAHTVYVHIQGTI